MFSFLEQIFSRDPFVCPCCKGQYIKKEKTEDSKAETPEEDQKEK